MSLRQPGLHSKILFQEEKKASSSLCAIEGLWWAPRPLEEPGRLNARSGDQQLWFSPQPPPLHVTRQSQAQAGDSFYREQPDDRWWPLLQQRTSRSGVALPGSCLC